jgi:hypothetical protein
MSLLDELKALTPQLPETECFIPEWGRAVTLRGFTVLEGRKLRQDAGKAGADPDNEALAIKTIAHAIADGATRPLANKDGVALIEGLSELTVRKLLAAFGRISLDEDAEGNSLRRADGNSGSTESRSPSAGQSLN